MFNHDSEEVVACPLSRAILVCFGREKKSSEKKVVKQISKISISSMMRIKNIDKNLIIKNVYHFYSSNLENVASSCCRMVIPSSAFPAKQRDIARPS